LSQTYVTTYAYSAYVFLLLCAAAASLPAAAASLLSIMFHSLFFLRLLLMTFHGGFVFFPVGELFEVAFPNAMSASAAGRATSLLLS
jgi:hypothetical protein